MRFEKSQMREGLGVRRMIFQEGAPCGLGRCSVPLLFQCNRCLALIFRRSRGLSLADGSSHREGETKKNLISANCRTHISIGIFACREHSVQPLEALSSRRKEEGAADMPAAPEVETHS